MDCGANIGNFSMICESLGATVLALEPDRREFSALEMNAEGRNITPLPYALWRESKQMEFYDCNDEGDSSLIDPGGASRSYLVQAMALDELAELPDGPIKLLKLEAEGAEPEIIDGMTKSLSRISFIAVDMGPERGVSKENTVVEVNDRLTRYGFRLVAFNPVRCTGLYMLDSS